MRFTTALASCCFLVCVTACRSGEEVPPQPDLTGQAGGSSDAQEERTSVPADINSKFLDPNADPEAFVKRWEIESREVYACQDAIVAAMELSEGSRVADIGTGTGLFLEALSGSVGGSGKVFALDISLAFLEHVRNRVSEQGWTNVQPILSGERTTALLKDSIDVAFASDVYHHFEYHEDMLRSIRNALRPGGRFVVVDFERIPGVTREWLLGHVRAPKETVIEEIETAGFRLIDEIDVDGFVENYLLRFEVQK